ncbi:MAG: D-alanyl-D-alanine carboxypeptidase/D-alanyl-D-alanine-endopeptidase [Neisseriaceae bacterium]
MRIIFIFLICISCYCNAENCSYKVKKVDNLKAHLSNKLTVNIPDNIKPNTSILVADSTTGLVKYSLNSDQPRLIASNMKLFTSYFALSELKPDFHWQTKLYYTGNVSNGVLYGNIYLVGGGDPTLDDKAIFKIFSILKQNGIKKIKGNVILDSSIFNSIPRYSFLNTNPYDVDTILPSGLMINGEINHVILTTSRQSVVIKSDVYGFEAINNLKVNVAESICSDLYNKIKIDKHLNKIIFSGTVSYNCNNRNLAYRLLSNFAYNRTIVYKVLNDFNITIYGDVISGALNIKMDHPKELYVYNSPSLEQVLISMNKFSINLIAETLLLSIGAFKTSNQNTYLQGKDKFVNFLKQRHLLNNETVVENGAGLSRYERFSVKNIIDLLQQVNNSPYRSEFIASLDIPGEEGWLKNRFTQYQDNVHAKTGTLNDTMALSGYFLTKNNKVYLFSIVFNCINILNRSQVNQINGIILDIFKQIQ